MARLTARDASIRVFVFREGVARSIGHDIEIDVPSFWMDVSTGPSSPEQISIDATIDAGSLRVLGSVKGGSLDEDALSRHDKATIERAIRDDILDSSRFPTITFRSSRIALSSPPGTRARIEGQLTLKGITRPLDFDAILHGGHAGGHTGGHTGAHDVSAEVVIDQTSFGIKPYTALLGALRVKREVLVRVRAPLDKLGLPA